MERSADVAAPAEADILYERYLELARLLLATADARTAHEALCGAARAGDTLAVEPLERAGLGLGHAIASVALVVDIETVILMGGLSGASDLLIPWAQTGIRERIYSLMADRIHIVQGALGDRAGVVGAAIWAMDSGS